MDHVLDLHTRITDAHERGRMSSAGPLGLGVSRKEMLENVTIALRRAPGDLLAKTHFQMRIATTDEEARRIGLSAIESRRDQLASESVTLGRDRDRLERIYNALIDVETWSTEGYALGGVADSLLHRVTADNTYYCATELDWKQPEIAQAQASTALGVFLVQHDWKALIEGTEVDAGAYRLPFEFNCFEMEIAGRHICALVCCEDGEPWRLIPLIRCRGGWLVICTYDVRGDPIPEGMNPDRGTGLACAIMQHVRAIAIMLDAEVVESEIVRAPHRSNAAVKRDAPAPFAFHTLSLVNRRKALRLNAPSGRHGVRLHFRRGHWRHFANHKTWIRWMLVGDAALGFADKDYRL